VPQSLATANADEPELRRTWQEFEYGVEVCIVNNGANVEHLCKNFMSFITVFRLFDANHL
jgi:hypothetical protein